ncbi:hypothetical protein OIV83_003592 [Microbotryomycetes sp. JL201]|nr:hypothetical protein OIV83_003592 [Microbotryomycetes sp. JL201]
MADQTIELPHHASSDEAHKRAPSSASNSSKSTAFTHTSNTALHDDMLLASLNAGFEQFRLKHGRLSRLARTKTRNGLRDTIKGWWDAWTSGWDLTTNDLGSFVTALPAVPCSVMTRSGQYRQIIPLMSQFTVINSSVLPILLFNNEVLALGAGGIDSNGSTLSDQDLVAIVRYLTKNADKPKSLQVRHSQVDFARHSRDSSMDRLANPTSAQAASSSKWTSSMSSYLMAPSMPSVPGLPSVSMPSMPSMPSMSVPSIAMPSLPSIPGLSSTPPQPSSSPPRTSTSLSIASGWSLRKSSWNLLAGTARRAHSKTASETSITVGMSSSTATYPPPPSEATHLPNNDEEIQSPPAFMLSSRVTTPSASTPQVELAPEVDSSALAEAMGSFAIRTTSQGSTPATEALKEIGSCTEASGGDGLECEARNRLEGEVTKSVENVSIPAEVEIEETHEEAEEEEESNVLQVFVGKDDDPRWRGGLLLAVVSDGTTDKDAVQWMASRANRLLEAVETILEPVLPPKPPYPHRHVIKTGPFLTVAHWPMNEHSWSGKADDDEADILSALVDANQRLNRFPESVESFIRLGSSSHWVVARRTDDNPTTSKSGVCAAQESGSAVTQTSKTVVFVVLPAKFGKDGSLVDAAEELRRLDMAYQSAVACFKQHKVTDCTLQSQVSAGTSDTGVGSADKQEGRGEVPPSLKTPENPSLQPLPLGHHGRDDDDDYDSLRPSKRLKDLRWPAEPSPGLWLDPLARNDVKPLRGFEYEAVATDPVIRSVLGDKSLRTTLKRLTELGDDQSRRASLRLLLGLTNVTSVPTQYRTGVNALSTLRYSTGFGGKAAYDYGRTGSGTRHSSRGGGRGRGQGRSHFGHRAEPDLLPSTPEERTEVAKFVEAVQRALTSARQAKGERE